MNELIAAPGPLMVDVAGVELDGEDRALLAHPAVGGAILFARNYADPEQLAALTTAMRAVRSNLLIVCDYEGGRVQRFRDGFTRIPPMRALGRQWRRDPDRAKAAATHIGWLMAAELAAVGVDMPLAPVVDLDYGQSSVIGDRAFAADARTTAILAGALMDGLKQAGSVATAKHFPGHGHVVPDSHAELPVDEREIAALTDDMTPYAPLIARGLASVMMAHIRYPAVDALPASLSPRWTEQMLRQDMGFDGCVFCDDLSMGGAAAIGDYRERARLALAAGCDYLPVCNNRVAVNELIDGIPVQHDAAQDRRQALRKACTGAAGASPLDTLRARPAWQRAAAAIESIDTPHGAGRAG